MTKIRKNVKQNRGSKPSGFVHAKNGPQQGKGAPISIGLRKEGPPVLDGLEGGGRKALRLGRLEAGRQEMKGEEMTNAKIPMSKKCPMTTATSNKKS
jgi:hypothetical protein